MITTCAPSIGVSGCRSIIRTDVPMRSPQKSAAPAVAGFSCSPGYTLKVEGAAQDDSLDVALRDYGVKLHARGMSAGPLPS
jgi:hypothetical protein